MGDRITKAMPPAVMGKDIPLSGIFDPQYKRYSEAGEFRSLYESDPDVRKVVDTAKGLEGLKRQWGVHAAGVILSAEPLLDVIPIQRREQDGAIITQFDMGACESLGLLKMDFLGLRNLTVLDDCLYNMRVNGGSPVVLENLELTDKTAYELLARGDTLGVFQLDGGPMRSLLRSMVPDNFEDISAVLALYRPGPMGANAHNDYADRKNGRKPVEPIHPELAEPLADILGDTYGLIVYQEQVMAIAQKLAGYSLGAADLLRRAMGKKKKEILDKEYIPFSEGMKANGYSDGAIKTLWDILVPFSDYAFNKAHTAGYGLVSYWTAYLKANHPAEYMAALLTSVRDDKDKSALYLNECRRMGIRVLPPDVNSSDANFTPRGGDIVFGLSAVRNVGTNVVAGIVEARARQGQFSDFQDFLRKVPAGVCNKKTIESLIKGGPARADAGPRAGHRRDHRREAERGDRPGLAVRRVRRRRAGRRRRCHVRRGGAGGRVGQTHPAGLRAGDARPVRLGPSAAGHRGRSRRGRRLLHRLLDRGRGPGRRFDAHRGRSDHRVAAQADQAGQRLGDRHGGGSRRGHRVHVLPGGARQRRGAARRGHRRCGQGPAGPSGGRAAHRRIRVELARRHEGRGRPGGGPAARGAVHAAPGRAAT
jgi:DNA polymerase-3 subunit alpha